MEASTLNENGEEKQMHGLQKSCQEDSARVQKLHSRSRLYVRLILGTLECT